MMITIDSNQQTTWNVTEINFKMYVLHKQVEGKTD